MHKHPHHQESPLLEEATYTNIGGGVIRVEMKGKRAIVYLPDWVIKVVVPDRAVPAEGRELYLARKDGAVLDITIGWDKYQIVNDKYGPHEESFKGVKAVHLIQRDGVQEWVALNYTPDVNDIVEEQIQPLVVRAEAAAVEASGAATDASDKARESVEAAQLSNTKAEEALVSANKAQEALDAFQDITAEATTLAPGSDATSSFNPLTGILNLGIPRGYDGSTTGDMMRNVYDPSGKNADAFSMVNMAEGPTQKILSDDERTKLANIETGAQKNAVTSVAGRTGAVTLGMADIAGLASAVPLGTIQHWIGKRANIPDGWVALDGQLVNRADFPDLWPMVQAGAFPVLSDATWQSDITKRGLFSSGNGTTTFRFPDANGKYTGSLQGLYLRGDGKTGTSSGQILEDAIRNITGEFAINVGVGVIGANAPTSGALTKGTAYSSFMNGASAACHGARFDASLAVPTADENRPVSLVTIVIMRVRGGTSVIPAPGSAATLMSNVFNGNQRINGDMEVSGTLTGKAPAGDASKFLRGDGMWGGVLGAGVAWNNVTAQRALETNYVNTSGRPLGVSVAFVAGTNTGGQLLVDGVVIATFKNTYGTGSPEITLFGIVPAGSTYRVNRGAGTMTWMEL